jgi:hypothetical protein
MLKSAILIAIKITLAALVATPLGAQENSRPILTISGAIGNSTGASEITYDQDSLAQMMTASITTSTPWFDGTSVFEGISLEELIGNLNANATKITAIALNDYITEIPFEDIQAQKPILALKRDGQFMSVRDKGPLFIIYPYDSKPELRTHLYYSRSAWQVAKLVIE